MGDEMRESKSSAAVLAQLQILPGHKNELRLEINGRSASVAWNSEDANNLWIGYYDRANENLTKDPSMLKSEARAYADLPAGHRQARPDAFGNIVADIYALIRSGQTTPPPNSTVTPLCAATHVATVIHAMLASYNRGTWRKIQK
jgi:hypothetical protein